MDSKTEIALEYLVRAFMDQPHDVMSVVVNLRNGKQIHILITYVKESK